MTEQSVPRRDRQWHQQADGSMVRAAFDPEAVKLLKDDPEAYFANSRSWRELL